MRFEWCYIYNACLSILGFCLKTKTDKNEKVFINICTADNVRFLLQMLENKLLSSINEWYMQD